MVLAVEYSRLRGIRGHLARNRLEAPLPLLRRLLWQYQVSEDNHPVVTELVDGCGHHELPDAQQHIRRLAVRVSQRLASDRGAGVNAHFGAFNIRVIGDLAAETANAGAQRG